MNVRACTQNKLKKISEKAAIAPQLLLTSPNPAPGVSFQPGWHLHRQHFSLLTCDLTELTSAQHPLCTAAGQQSYFSQTFPGFPFLFLFPRHRLHLKMLPTLEEKFLGGKMSSRYSTEAWPSLCPQKTQNKDLKELAGGNAVLQRREWQGRGQVCHTCVTPAKAPLQEWDPTQEPQGKGYL